MRSDQPSAPWRTANSRARSSRASAAARSGGVADKCRTAANRRIQAARVARSASGTWPCGGIAMAPHLPVPPFRMLAASCAGETLPSA